MRNYLFFAFIFITAIFTTSGFGQYSETAQLSNSAKNTISKPTVLVELFTSVSCAACPPAEKMLTKLETEQPFEDAELITLEFHVGYKDGFGQRDGYASPLFTQRQEVYDRKFRTGNIYTPQMVVDGDIQFAGNNLNKAEKAVNNSVKNEKAEIKLVLENEGLNVKILNIPEQTGSTVYLAIAEDGLATRGNKDLKNVSTVRRLSGLGRIDPNQKSFAMDINFQMEKDWKKENIKFVVFIQENSSRKVLGVERIK